MCSSEGRLPSSLAQKWPWNAMKSEEPPQSSLFRATSPAPGGGGTLRRLCLAMVETPMGNNLGISGRLNSSSGHCNSSLPIVTDCSLGSFWICWYSSWVQAALLEVRGLAIVALDVLHNVQVLLPQASRSPAASQLGRCSGGCL